MKFFLILLSLFAPLLGKPILDLRDRNMSKAHRSRYERPDFIWMTRGKHSSVVVLTDTYLCKAKKMRAKGYEHVIAYLLEPKVINKKPYDLIKHHSEDFDLIFTYDQELLEAFPAKCRFVHATGSSTLLDHAIHQKSKLCSIFTGKNWTEGHRLRHRALEQFGLFFDGLKTDATPRVPWKDPWLKEYCFSVAVENSKAEYYFTEKIIDCFRSGTVPIYWGCPSIGKFFDLDGIIVFNSLEELKEILPLLSYEEYERRLPAIEGNFHRAALYPQCTLVERPGLPDAMDGIWPHVKRFLRK